MIRGKYEDLIDGETWAFVDRANQWYPPEATSLPLERQRAIYDAMCRDFHHGHPAGVSTHDGSIDAPGRAIPLRHYQAGGGGAAATILYYHGGGFVLGGLDSHDDICAELCAGTGYDVISVGYRLAPEHRHPAAFDDACLAFHRAAASGLPIILCGESAGGGLAAAVAHATRGHDRAAIGQVLIYPTLGGDFDKGSYVEHAEAPMLSVRDVRYYRDMQAGSGHCADDPRLAPLRDKDHSGLPATVVFTAQCDPLSSDGEDYRDRVVAAGGSARWQEEAGLVHGYLRARHSARRAGASFARIVDAIATLGRPAPRQARKENQNARNRRYP
jgi:acetyl esterase